MHPGHCRTFCGEFFQVLSNADEDCGSTRDKTTSHASGYLSILAGSNVRYPENAWREHRAQTAKPVGFYFDLAQQVCRRSCSARSCSEHCARMHIRTSEHTQSLCTNGRGGRRQFKVRWRLRHAEHCSCQQHDAHALKLCADGLLASSNA